MSDLSDWVMVSAARAYALSVARPDLPAFDLPEREPGEDEDDWLGRAHRSIRLWQDNVRERTP